MDPPFPSQPLKLNSSIPVAEILPIPTSLSPTPLPPPPSPWPSTCPSTSQPSHVTSSQLNNTSFTSTSALPLHQLFLLRHFPLFLLPFLSLSSPLMLPVPPGFQHLQISSAPSFVAATSTVACTIPVIVTSR